MTGYAISIQNAVRTPNEVRALEVLPVRPDGDKLMIQGATVPLGSAAPPIGHNGGPALDDPQSGEG